jgi:hypothetical protein
MVAAVLVVVLGVLAVSTKCGFRRVERFIQKKREENERNKTKQNKEHPGENNGGANACLPHRKAILSSWIAIEQESFDRCSPKKKAKARSSTRKRRRNKKQCFSHLENIIDARFSRSNTTSRKEKTKAVSTKIGPQLLFLV